MKQPSYAAATLLALLVSAGGAQDTGAGDLGKAQLGKAPERRTTMSFGDWGAYPARQVLAAEYTIAPGTTAYFAWPADLSGSERVGISVTTLSDPRSRLTNVRIGVAFAGPGEWYVLTNVILGSSFFYYDHGGATVPVYGPFLKLAVTNDGALPVRITQLAVYAVVH
jgi:hypothetical protein